MKSHARRTCYPSEGVIGTQSDGISRYLSRTRLGSIADAFGLRVLAVLVCAFVGLSLYGVTVWALLCALGLSALALLLLRALRKRVLVRSGARLRRRLGGELRAEALLVAPARRAHFECALLLSQLCPLELERTLSSGVLCTYNGERVLVRCLQKHPAQKTSAQDVADAQREALRAAARRAVLLCISPPDRACDPQAALSPPVRLIHRDALIDLLGAQSPATDEQLARLGARARKHKLRHALKTPARRLVGCAAVLVALWALSSSLVYLAPAAALLVLALAKKLQKTKPFMLFEE